MFVLSTKRNKPYIYCGKCRFGFMLLAKPAIQALSEVVKEVSESELPIETRKKYNEKKLKE